MICLLVLLFLSTNLLAQPVEGPWVVATTTHMITQPEVCVRGSNADLLYIEDDSVRYARFSLATHQLVAGPRAILPLPGWHTQELHDLIRVNDSTWACLVYMDQRPYMPYDSNLMRNRTVLLHGGDETSFYAVLDSGADHNYFPQTGDHYNEGFSLAARLGGGVVAARITSTFAGYDYGVAFELLAINNGFSVDSTYWGNIGLGNHPGNRAVVRSVGADSFMVVTTTDAGGELCAIGISDDQPICATSPSCDFGVVFDFGLTNAGNVKALGCFDVYSCTSDIISLEFLDSLLVCTDEGSVDLPSGIYATFWHPDYGFSLTHAWPSFLQLARVDTNGVQFLPTGTLAWHDDEYEIASANVTITDSGKIVAIWTQDGILDTSFFRVSLATVGWNTPLSTKPSEFVPHPSSLSLSAFPNPFNGETTIRYEMPQRTEVKISVFNILGKRVAELRNGIEEAGEHSLQWKADVSSGVYLVQLTAGQTHVTQKLMLLK